jgi:hypothetical protein
MLASSEEVRGSNISLITERKRKATSRKSGNSMN